MAIPRTSPLTRAFEGLIFSFASPLGWALIQLATGVNLIDDLQNNPGVYIYMAAGTALVFSGFGYYVGIREKQLATLALIDPLTGLHNGRYFQERLHEAYAMSRRLGDPLSLILIDLDHFKKINDTHGHLAGDEILQAVSETLKNACRGGETVARVGGEEMVVLLPSTTCEDAAAAAERFRHEIAQIFIFADGTDPICVTASAGVASTENKKYGERDLYSAADEAMYRAKQEGRDRVCVA